MTFGEELVAMDGTTPAAAAAQLSRPASTCSASTAASGPSVCLDALVEMGTADGPPA